MQTCVTERGPVTEEGAGPQDRRNPAALRESPERNAGPTGGRLCLISCLPVRPEPGSPGAPAHPSGAEASQGPWGRPLAASPPYPPRRERGDCGSRFARQQPPGRAQLLPPCWENPVRGRGGVGIFSKDLRRKL